MTENVMRTWRSALLAASFLASPVAAVMGGAGCDKNPDTATPAACTFPKSCLVLDGGPPPIDGTKPIPVQNCIAVAARAILTIEQQVGALGVKSATSPTVKGIAQQMNDDFTAALADLDSLAPGLGLDFTFDCPDKEAATALVQPALTQLQSLSGAAFDQQFVTLEGVALQQALDFYNEELIANANSGAFKNSLRYERWRFAGDGGAAVVKLFAPDASCPSPAVAPAGASPTCLGIIAEMMALTDGGGAD
jgi:predicted outer membrane protein